MADLTYSSDSNALRGLRRAFPDLCEGRSADFLRAEYLGECGQRSVVELNNVALAQADRLGEVAGSTMPGVPVLRRSASGTRPVSLAWSVYSRLPAGTSRRDAVAAAVAQGVAFYTARTQYQRWSRAA